MWFWKRSDGVRLGLLEERIIRLEGKITSAADLLDATERMDRIIKRSFRLNKQLELLEADPKVANLPPSGVMTRAELLRRGA